MEDADSRMIFDLQTKTIDMGARRATDMAHNTRLILPQPRSAAEEAVLGARQMVWKETAARYRKENCSEDGSPKQHNMTQTQRIGMKKLAKRIKAGEICVLPADKGNRLTVSSLQSFERQGDSHTINDRKVTRQELESTQTRMNNLSRGLAKVFATLAAMEVRRTLPGAQTT